MSLNLCSSTYSTKFFTLHSSLFIYFCTFAPFLAPKPSREGGRGGRHRHVKKAFINALFLAFQNFANYRIPFVIYWNTIYYKWYFISRNKTETKVLKNHILMFFMFLLFVFPSFDFILSSWWNIFKYCRGTKFVSSRKHLFLLTYFFFLIIHWLFCFQLQR